MTDPWLAKYLKQGAPWLPDPTLLTDDSRLALRRFIAIRIRSVLANWGVTDEVASYEVARHVMGDFQP